MRLLRKCKLLGVIQPPLESASLSVSRTVEAKENAGLALSNEQQQKEGLKRRKHPGSHMAQSEIQEFESEGFLLQVHSGHIIYAEKSRVRFDFRNIARVRIYRAKPDGEVSKITERVKGELGSFQIDGFGDSDMERIAASFEARAKEFSILIQTRETRVT